MKTTHRINLIFTDLVYKVQTVGLDATNCTACERSKKFVILFCTFWKFSLYFPSINWKISERQTKNMFVTTPIVFFPKNSIIRIFSQKHNYQNFVIPFTHNRFSKKILLSWTTKYLGNPPPPRGTTIFPQLFPAGTTTTFVSMLFVQLNNHQTPFFAKFDQMIAIWTFHSKFRNKFRAPTICRKLFSQCTY